MQRTLIPKQKVRQSMKDFLDKFLSGRYLTTLLLTLTYCTIMLMVSYASCKLLLAGKSDAEKLISFVIGNLTGTAMGAIIAYHFRTDRTVPNDTAQTTTTSQTTTKAAETEDIKK